MRFSIRIWLEGLGEDMEVLEKDKREGKEKEYGVAEGENICTIHILFYFLYFFSYFSPIFLKTHILIMKDLKIGVIYYFDFKIFR